MPTPGLITTAQVAERLGVDVRTVTRMVADGRLTATAKAPGLRGAYLYSPADVEALGSTADSLALADTG